MKSRSTDARHNGAIANGQHLNRASSILARQEVGTRGNSRLSKRAHRNTKRPETKSGDGQIGGAFDETVLAGSALDGTEDEYASDKAGNNVPVSDMPDTNEPDKGGLDDGFPPIRAIDVNDPAFFPEFSEKDEEPVKVLLGETEVAPVAAAPLFGNGSAARPDVVQGENCAGSTKTSAAARSVANLPASRDGTAGAQAQRPADVMGQAAQAGKDDTKGTAEEGVSGPTPHKRIEFPKMGESDDREAPAGISDVGLGNGANVAKGGVSGSSVVFGKFHGSKATDVVPFSLPEDKADAEVGTFMSVAELGAYLKSARERRGVSLDKVSETLRISRVNLEALEAGDTGHFVSPAYARGFLRTYARFLRIPEDKCTGVYAQLNTTQSYSTSVYTPNKDARPRKTSPLWGILASLLIACLVSFGIWHFRPIAFLVPKNEDGPQTAAPFPSSTSPQVDRMRLESEKELQRRAEERKARENGQSGDKEPGRSGLQNDLRNDLRKDSQNDSQNGPQGDLRTGSRDDFRDDSRDTSPQNHVEQSPLKSLLLVDAGEREPLPAVVTPGSVWSTLQGNATIAGQAEFASVPTAAVEESVNEAGSLGIPQSDANTVVVVAEDTCWFSATVDRDRSQQRTLQTGESVPFRFEERLRLRVGNAGGVRIFYNGEELERGGRGQVRNLVFPPKGRAARAAGNDTADAARGAGRAD